jgi:hypothetical protein
LAAQVVPHVDIPNANPRAGDTGFSTADAGIDRNVLNGFHTSILLHMDEDCRPYAASGANLAPPTFSTILAGRTASSF